MGQDGANSVSEHIITSGGARIVLSVWAPPAPDAAVVFIPATMVYPLYYEPLLRGFAERGFAVVWLHPVGHGKSPRIVFNAITPQVLHDSNTGIMFYQSIVYAPELDNNSARVIIKFVDKNIYSFTARGKTE